MPFVALRFDEIHEGLACLETGEGCPFPSVKWLEAELAVEANGARHVEHREGHGTDALNRHRSRLSDGGLRRRRPQADEYLNRTGG